MSLHDAVVANDLEGVTFLVDQGADKDEIFGKLQETALCVAAAEGYLDIVMFLVEQGADMEKRDGGHWTPLMIASDAGQLDVVRYLFEQGADRDKAANDGCTSLHYAADGGYTEIAKLLMVYGADLNASNIVDDLPIDWASTEEIKQAIRDEPSRRMDEARVVTRRMAIECARWKCELLRMLQLDW